MIPVLVWLATAGATPVFTLRTPPTLPAVRRSSDCALKPDPAGLSDELYSYGGFNGATLSDVPLYRTGTNQWGTGTAAVVPARERHAMAYDPVHDVVVVVGGGNGFSVFDNITLISGATASFPTLPALRPSARIDAALVWAPTLGKFLYFGGSANVLGTNHLSDLWTLDVADGGVSWQQVAISGSAPSARGAVCAAWDPDRGQLMVFGGETNGPAFVGDLWTWSPDGGNWSQPVAAGAPPSARAFAACDRDQAVKQLVLYGGQASGGPLGGVWTFDPATRIWTAFTPSPNPGTLSDSAAAYSPQLKGTLFFAGRSAATTYTNATWLLRFNSPPAIDAGPNQAVGEGATVTLSGSYSDPDLDTCTAQFIQVAGPAVTLSGSPLTPTFTAPPVALTTNLVFTFSVSDGIHGVSSDMTVTVANVINDVPIAGAGADQTVDAGATVTLVGTGVDPNNDPLTYAWSQLAGPPVTLSAASSAVTTFTAPSPTVTTVLAFRLVVNDGMAPSLPDDVFVTVNAVPFVDAGVDAGPPDAGTPDAGTPDAGTPDAGTPDAGTPDSGNPDSGTPDAGTPDAGTPDAGTPDAGTPDAGTPDAGNTADAGTPPEDAGMTADAGGSGMAADGGPMEPRALSVGCGCQQGPSSLAWLAALLLLAHRRRRPLSAGRR